MIHFPDSWDVHVATLPQRPSLTKSEIDAIIRQPVAGPTLAEVVESAQLISIAVEDMTRPAPTAEIVPVLLDQLLASGVRPEQVRLFVATGAHRAATRIDAEKKLGTKAVRNFEVHYHSCFCNLVHIGDTKHGTPLWINRRFAECDVKITIGTISPHDYAGFGGGAKTAAVGLAGLDTLDATHGRCIDDQTNFTGSLDRTSFRDDLEEMADRVGLSFSINAVVGRRRELVHLTAGAYRESHAAGCQFANNHYRADIPKEADLVVLNAYPKDTDLLQVMMALNVGFFARPEMVKQDGLVLVTGSCPEGAGIHYLAGKDMRGEYRLKDAQMLGRENALYSDKLTAHEHSIFMPPSMQLLSSWDDALGWMKQRLPARALVTVLTHTTLQLPRT